MKVVFISNYFNHHQKPFCEAMNAADGVDFVFIETIQMREERRLMGYEMKNIPSYVLKAYESDAHMQKCKKLLFNADVVIMGSAPYQYVRDRIKAGKIVLRYSERIHKRGFDVLRYIPRMIKWQREYNHKNIYQLCASAYAAADLSMYGLFIGKTYKWGYFPQVKSYEIDTLMAAKERKMILWCARFLDWKHPDACVELAKRLKEDGIDFCIKMIGAGEIYDKIRLKIEEAGLAECIELLGVMNPEQVRAWMEKAGVFICTSDYQEGWGAVLNEAMNSGCAVVSSHAVGSAPYLIQHGENGLLYQCGNTDDLYAKVRCLLNDTAKQSNYGMKAYCTISEEWNADVAAERLLQLIVQLQRNGRGNLYAQGPCSSAGKLKNNWFKG